MTIGNHKQSQNELGYRDVTRTKHVNTNTNSYKCSDRTVEDVSTLLRIVAAH